MKPFRLFVILLFFVSFHAAGQYDSLQPQGIYSSNFIIDELSRDITYYMPLHYGQQDTYPLLIFLHDDKSNAKNAIKKYGDYIHHKADSAGCMVMYPDAVSGHWNSHTGDSVNDAGFISIMIQFFVQQYHCNPKRIYLMGIGNGGTMCNLIGCKGINHPAAVATINATDDIGAFSGCFTKEAMAVSNIKSEADVSTGIAKACDFLFRQNKKEE